MYFKDQDLDRSRGEGYYPDEDEQYLAPKYPVKNVPRERQTAEFEDIASRREQEIFFVRERDLNNYYHHVCPPVGSERVSSHFSNRNYTTRCFANDETWTHVSFYLIYYLIIYLGLNL